MVNDTCSWMESSMKKVYALALGLVVAHAAMTVLGEASSITTMLSQMRDGIRAMVANEAGVEVMLIIPFGMIIVPLIGFVVCAPMALGEWLSERYAVPFRYAVAAAIAYVAGLGAGIYFADTGWSNGMPAMAWYALPMLGAAVVHLVVHGSEHGQENKQDSHKSCAAA